MDSSFGEICVMLRTSWLMIAGFASILVVQAESASWAQGDGREDRFFRFLDRNGDGVLSGDELSNMDDRMRERLREVGLDTRREIRRDDFVQRMASGSSSRGDSRGGPGDRGGFGDRGGPRGPSGNATPAKAAPPPPVNLKLPANYAAFDKDGDNQIGMYEWDRGRLAEFLALDRNGDGFITARELANPRTPDAATAVTTTGAAPTSAVTVVTSSGTGATVAIAASTPGATTTVTAVPAATASSAEESPEAKRAKYFFSITDKDKNGEISSEEWTASRGVRVMFEKANINPPLPMKEAAFVQQFLAMQAK